MAECGCNENCLEKFKIDYESLRKKYNLPSCNELGEEFDIERAAEKQSSFLLREIRRTINDKVSAYLHLFETFMNPSSAPVFVFSMLKNLGEDEKKEIKDIYKKIARMEIQIFKIDTVYNEKSEAEFIINSYKEWSLMKNKIAKIIDKLGSSFEIDSTKGSRGYFG